MSELIEEVKRIAAEITADREAHPERTALEDLMADHFSWTPGTMAAVRKLADAILAAGYSKPRTITTAEELDAMPVGSVVLHNGRAFQHYPAYPGPFDEYRKWSCGDGGFVRSTKDGSAILPASVLYEPRP